MRKRYLTTALVLFVIPLAGWTVSAAARAVSTEPQPAYISNDRAQPDDKGGEHPARVSDDPVTHDANDDMGGLRPAGVSDDPVTHDANDDNGGDRPAGVTDDPATHDVTDDPATHDVNDDNGGGADDSATHDAGDDGGHHRNRGGDD